MRAGTDQSACLSGPCGVLTSPFLYEEGHQSASLSSHQSALPVSLSVCWCCVLVCQHSPRQPAVRGVGPRRAVIGQPCVPALARRCTTRQGPPPRVEGSPRLAAVCTPAPAPAIPGVTCTCLRSRAAAADVGGVVVLCVAAGGLGSLPRGSWPSPFCLRLLLSLRDSRGGRRLQQRQRHRHQRQPFQRQWAWAQRRQRGAATGLLGPRRGVARRSTSVRAPRALGCPPGRLSDGIQR